jgi:predicted patatin/cPLA2 family phospholipase
LNSKGHQNGYLCYQDNNYANMSSMQLAERLLTPGSEHTTELVANIQRKQELLEAGDPAHENIRTALVIGGGTMRGVFSGGVVIGLEELGLTEVFDDVIGVSVGASTSAYFLARQAALGTTLFFEELTGKDFIDKTRLIPPRSGALNIDYLRDIFTGKKALDQAVIHANRSRFYIGVTDINNVQPRYIEVAHDEDQDLIKLIQASSAVPGVTQPVVIDGVTYGDGITTCKNPIRFAIEELGSTDIFCILNQELRRDPTSLSEQIKSIGEMATSAMLTRNSSPKFRRAFRKRHIMSDEVADTDYSADVRIGVICPEGEPVGRFEQDPDILIPAAQRATRQTKALFE